MKITLQAFIAILHHLGLLFFVRVGVLLLLILMVVVLRGQIEGIAQKTKQNRAAIFLQTDQLARQAQLRQQREMLYPLVARMKNFLPSQLDLARFREDISVIAEKNTVQASLRFGIEPVPSSAIANLKEITIFLTVSGSGTAYTGFLRDLSAMPYFIRLDSLVFDAQGGLEGTTTVQASGILFLK